MSSDDKIMEGGGEGSSHDTHQAITCTIHIMAPTDLGTNAIDSALVASVEAQDTRQESDSSLLVVPGDGDDAINVSAKNIIQTVTETNIGSVDLPVISNINSDQVTEQSIELVTKDEKHVEDIIEEDIGCHCLICNEELQEQDNISVFKSFTATSQRKVSIFLGDLVGQKLTSRKTHSTIICDKCFKLLNKLDLLEFEIQETKEEIITKYQETIAAYGGRARRKKPAAAKKSDYVFPKIEPEEEDKEGIEIEGDEIYQPQVDDLLEEEQDRREDRDSLDEEWEPEVKRARIKRESNTDPNGPPKRKRGRPRKDASKTKDVVVIGTAANSPVGEDLNEAGIASGAVSIFPPKPRLRHHRPASYKPCELCGIIPFSDVERHMSDYHPETLIRPCALCDQRFRTFRQLGNHVLRVHGLCYLCPECSPPCTFSAFAEFMQHVQERHPQTSASLMCVVCRSEFENMQDYCCHMETHEEEAAILLNSQFENTELSSIEVDEENNFCTCCKKKLKNPAALKRHMLHIHGKRPSFPCEVCYLKFHSTGALLDHTETHSTGVIQCPLCSQQFAKFNHLRSHCDTVHANATVFQCQYCALAAKSISALFTHVIVHHPDKLGLERNVRCTKCGEKFYSGRELTQHKLAHHTEMVSCSYCNKTMSKYVLSSHVNEKHTKERKMLCTFCGQVFFKSVNLNAHIKRHHMRSQYARFICQICSKAYITRDELQRHVAAHQNERKFKCEFCNRAYFKAGDLTYHRRSHTGERPHACNSCGAAFSRPSELTTHMARAHGVHNFTRRYQRTAAHESLDTTVKFNDLPISSLSQTLQTVSDKPQKVDKLINESKEDEEIVHVLEGDESLEVVHAVSQDANSEQTTGDMQVIYVELME
ncbi:PR domain zinc finger protein 5-like isoform X7 [Macrobrachium rosenbergii]|uniref:PR domain zinc finger protein 5-like isoform X7 n=1 Tax=Macrobrachium rosenbergii TaxID=79674 RepID=UPI0034D6C306